jgi:hypothetical protein
MSNYHHDFWTVSATLAPALGVTVVVLINRYTVAPMRRALRDRPATQSTTQTEVDTKPLKRAERYGICLFIGGWVGGLAAAIAMGFSLWSLASRTPTDACNPFAVFWLLVIAAAAIPINALFEDGFLKAAAAAGFTRREVDSRAARSDLVRGAVAASSADLDQ